MVRAETSGCIEEFLSQFEIGLNEELSATQQEDRAMLNDYQSITIGERVPCIRD